MQQLRELAVNLAMGRANGDDLPMAAAQALVRGVDSPSLRELAGLSRGESREAVDVFRQAMDELGYPVPDEPRARLLLMRAAADGIIAGEDDPADLAYEIYRQAYDADLPDRQEVMDRFLALYMGWDDTFEDRESAVNAMRDAATTFLRTHPV